MIDTETPSLGPANEGNAGAAQLVHVVCVVEAEVSNAAVPVQPNSAIVAMKIDPVVLLIVGVIVVALADGFRL
jgi:hypothetical protein